MSGFSPDAVSGTRASSGSPTATAAWLVVAAGGVAALHVGKLPPAIPVLQASLGLTLVQAGFLLSVVQFTGMLAGVFVGLMADRLGPRRVMLAGLALLALGSLLGAVAPDVPALLATRMLESAGLLLTVLPAPGLLRRLLTEPRAQRRALGVWGAYMPVGTALALLAGPWAYATLGWRLSWALLGGVSLLALTWVVRWVPADSFWVVGNTHLEDKSGRGQSSPSQSPRHSPVLHRLALVWRSGSAWLLAGSFFMYSGQWLAVIGFLPTVYSAAGWSVTTVGLTAALAAGVNMLGNVAAGRWLGRGASPVWPLLTGFLAMGGGALLAFGSVGATGGPVLQYLAVLVFSAVGGLIPGTLFALAVQLAPSEGTVSATVGWMQQLSSLGQFAGPPAVAALAVWAGGWQFTGWFTAACSLLGMALALGLQRQWNQTAAPAAVGRTR